ncbi:deoxyribodipyrimidine photo-lyase [Hymenobacter busanensis]|uniref:Deoxyribodipyrimidine photo-lyase n=1 Tax=Hymenobacter busanensis TaxID=2607656 RepID=A0A7L4ZZD7_9BACT|nr:deoxyribodipyrimidine photo-lyase [Hymenobacter busanensis]KAA9339400.1 deoxyribodipyrimidine photo-lyase [Hymenobacter busanensis]QHJ06840.1 deoxyribodipyrimidine photo-lyase [Hymenobacter busanensis]
MKVALFWHRRDLRRHDNAGLAAALQSGLPVVPLFIYDTDILDHIPRPQDARLTFIYDEVERLAGQTEAAGGTFLARYGKPAEVFQQLLRQYDIGAVFANEDYEPYALRRDTAVAELLEEHGVALTLLKDQVIFAKNEILTQSGKPHRSFGPYRTAWLAALRPDLLHPYPSAELFAPARLVRLLDAVPRPTLADMGFERLEQYVPAAELPTDDLVRRYHETRDFPGLVNSSTRRSVHLRFGTLSVRELMHQAQTLNPKLLAELVWRDYFMMLLWHYPFTAYESYEPRLREVPYRNDETEFQRWCAGQTGYPLVDAGMRELNQTGFLHNRARIAVASFLIKHLLIDWRLGERYFADKLLDYDLALNVGNWQWVAGTGVVAAPWFRVYSPASQLRSYDPELEYVHRWVPEFGTSTYSTPLVEHKAARQRAIDTFRQAYQTAGHR